MDGRPSARRHRFTGLIAVAFAFALLPAADASWYGPGTTEPDTAHDRTDGLMYADPPNAAERAQVYFNAFPTLGASTANPNVGLAGTHFAAFPREHWEAQLGVWRDCNGDGAIGLAESALIEYRAELLTSTATCPVDTKDRHAHNDGTIVRESIPIGRAPTCEAYRQHGCLDARRYVHWFDTVRVWGDTGAPGERDIVCPVAALPRGTTASTGGILAYADCYAARGIATRINDASTTADPDDLAGLRFEDPRNPQRSSSVLNTRLPAHPFRDPDSGTVGFLDSGTGRPMASSNACENGSDLEIGGPERHRITSPIRTGLWVEQRVRVGHVALSTEQGWQSESLFIEVGSQERGAVARMPAVFDASLDAEGSAWDAATTGYDTHVEQCTGDGPVEPGPTHSAFELIESDAAALGVAPKERSDIVMRYSPGGGKYYLPAAGLSTPIRDDHHEFLPREAQGSPGWAALTSETASHATLTRAYLQAGGVRYHTFYAYLDTSTVSSKALALPAGSAHLLYGSEACQHIAQGAAPQNGWDCDPDGWWRTGPGGVYDIMPRDADGFAYGARPGDAYQLRDVDCYTGPLSAVGGTDPCI